MTIEEEKSERRDGDRRQVDRREVAANEHKKSGSNIWFILSFALTAIIIGWGFSLPFRKHDRPLLVWDETDIPGRNANGVRKVRLTQDEADAYRAAAIQRDREFLRERRDRIRQTAHLPGADEAQKANERRVASTKKTIEGLRDAPHGSLQEKYREDLENSLDAPQ